MTIYLYVKTHCVTGLKYLGQTTSDPFLYHGSGVYWISHLNKHGYNYNTVVLRECQDKKELKEWGLYYSHLWNVVESNEWANLKEECGDGGRQSKEVRKKISEAGKGRVPWNKGISIWDDDNRKRISNQNKLRGKQSIETITKRAISNTGKKRNKTAIDNLTYARRKRAETEIVSQETKNKMSQSAKKRGFNGYGFKKGDVSHNAKIYQILDIDNNKVFEIFSLRKWCLENKISYGSIWKAFKNGKDFKGFRKVS